MIHLDAEFYDGIRPSLVCLPANQRAVLMLHFQGLTFKECGHWLAMTPNSAGYYYKKGIVRLKASIRMEKDGPVWELPTRSESAAKRGFGDFWYLSKEGRAKRMATKRLLRLKRDKINQQSREQARIERRYRFKEQVKRVFNQKFHPLLSKSDRLRLLNDRSVIWDGESLICREQIAVQIVKRLRSLGYEKISVGRWWSKESSFYIGFDLSSQGIFGERTFLIYSQKMRSWRWRNSQF